MIFVVKNVEPRSEEYLVINLITPYLMKAKILLLLLPFATLAMAQTDNSARAAQELVISVSGYVELTTAQTSKLSLAATQYVEAVKSANSQYTDDAEAMIKAKANAWQDYTMQLRSILSDEQYQTLQRKQQEHRQAVMNQIKGGTKQ